MIWPRVVSVAPTVSRSHRPVHPRWTSLGYGLRITFELAGRRHTVTARGLGIEPIRDALILVLETVVLDEDIWALAGSIEELEVDPVALAEMEQRVARHDVRFRAWLEGQAE